MTRKEIALQILKKCGPMSGGELRTKMNEGRSWWFKIRNSLAGFYYTMARLEDEKKVESWKQHKTYEGESVWITHYKIRSKND